MFLVSCCHFAGGRSRTGIALLANAVLANGSDYWVVVAERRVRTLLRSLIDSWCWPITYWVWPLR